MKQEPTSSSWRGGDATGPCCRLLMGQVLQNEKLLRPAHATSFPSFLPSVVENLGTKVLPELHNRQLLLGVTS